MRTPVYLALAVTVAGCGRTAPPRRDEPRAPVEAGAEADAQAAPDGPRRLTTELGEIDVLIGRPVTGKRIVASGRGAERDRNLCLVVNAPYQAWAGEGTYVHLSAFSPSLDGPAAEGEVYLGQTLVGRTDEHGAFAFRRRPEQGQTAEGHLTVRWQGKMGFIDFQSNSRTESFEAPVIYVQSDRGVYNPGQTIRVRALAWRLRGDYAPLADEEVRLELVSEAGRVVGGGQMRTDQWGVATLDLPLPPHAREGRYKLAAVHGRERAEGDLRIERFVPPEIEIRHDLGRFLTPEVDRLQVSLELGLFGGGAFRGGDLTVTATVDGREIHREKRSVEGPGPHPVAFDALLTKVHAAASPGDTVEVAFAVHDDDGRDDQVKRSLRYVPNPYKAVIELDRTRYAVGDPVQVMVRLVDLDDVPQRAKRLTLTVPALGEPLSGETDGGGVARFTFDAPEAPPGAAGELEVTLEEVAGALASAPLPVRAQLPMVSAIEETVVREGDEVPIRVRFPTDAVPREAVVHADVTDSSGSIVHSFLLPVEEYDDETVARGAFAAPSWGSMLLNLYVLGARGDDVGLMTDGQNVVVHPARELEVELLGLPEQAEPGGDLALEVVVRRPDGRTLDTILGVGVVDDAVISLLDPLERSPVDRFYNPERKVLASTGAQTLTWPVVSRNWGADRHDIGWPPRFGFHPGPTPDGEGRVLFGGCGGGALARLEQEAMAEPAPPPAPQGAEADQDGRTVAPARPGGPAKAEPVLIVRTDFDETGLWSPRVPAPAGKGRFEVALPDSITVQRVSVVASDREGGIGLALARVPVRQTLHVRAGLPATLTERDQVEIPVVVRNLLGDDEQVQVSLRSDDLGITGAARPLKVPAGGSATAWFRVRAKRAGPAAVEASARGRALHDVERRSVFVRPLGAPEVIELRGRAAAGSPFHQSFELEASDRHHVARARIALPTVVPGLQGLLELATEGAFGLDPAASRALAAAAVYRYLEARDLLTAERRRELRSRLGEVGSALLMSQNDDGGWGWLWDRRSNPFVTAYALQTLIELQELDLPVPTETLASAASYLLAGAGDEGLYTLESIAAWEGDSLAIREAGSAEIFDVLSRLPEPARGPEYASAMRPLAERFRRYLDGASPDPLTLAHALGGLHRAGAALAMPGLDPELRRAAARLARVRREVHWEPGWFDAFGGVIEATAVALEVLEALDPEGFEAAKADAVDLLLSTRGSWGAWHNARATAFAVRALTRLDPAPETGGGTIVVSVDGAEARRVEVDPGDPWGSALALREIELEGLGPGSHEVTVSVEGGLAARVTVEVERWPARIVEAEQAEGPRALVWSEAPETLRAGEPGELELTVRTRGMMDPVVVEQPLPPNVAVDPRHLDEQVRSGAITAYRITDGAVLLSPRREPVTSATIRFVAGRPGRVTIPPAVARGLLRQRVRNDSEPLELVVR